jgi:L-rhamnose mutarotase
VTLKKLLEITKPDEYNFISPCGLGDTMFICALKQAIEEKYNAPIHFIIKPSHKMLMDMYNISDYSVYQFTEDELRGISKSSHHPVKGGLYVAHPMYSDDGSLSEYTGKFNINFLQFYQTFFRLDKDSIFIEPVKYPENTIKDFSGLDKTALLLPEARSVGRLKRVFWEKLAGELREQGFNIAQSYSSEDFKMEGVEALPDDLYYVAAFAIHCSAVYALRNGLCDIIAGKAKRLTIFYPGQQEYNFFYMDYDNIKNILVDMKDKEPSKRSLTLKQKIKKVLKKLPPIKQLTVRFNSINERIDTEVGKLNRRFAEFYNDMLYLARIRGQGSDEHY